MQLANCFTKITSLQVCIASCLEVVLGKKVHYYLDAMALQTR